MTEINYACTGEINGDWYAIDVIADYQPEEPETYFDPGCPSDLIITCIMYVSNGEYLYLDETEWTPELLEHLVAAGFEFIKRRRENDLLEAALFRAA
jgi:hypothetical protein